MVQEMDTTRETTTDRARIAALIKVLFEARFDRDLVALKRYLSPDMVYRMVGHRIYSPFSGEFKGPDAVVAGVQNMNIEFEFSNMSIDRMLIDGNDVGVRWHGRWRNRGTNASATFEGFAHLEIENGLVKSYTNFVDTALVANISGWEP